MRAVVLGAGIAGLCAAAALHSRGDDVVVLDPDAFPTVPSPRPGVPQSRQLHNLLGRAQLHLGQLFPGVVDRIVDAGGVRAVVASQTHVFELGVDMPERDVGLHIISAPQPLIEHVIRASLPGGVQLRTGVRGLGLRFANGRICGVETTEGDVECSLVVDASGARSPVPQWLINPPPVTEHAFRQWYSTLEFERPAGWHGRPDFWLTFPSASVTRGGLLSPSGTTRWRASVSGFAGDLTPTTAEEFLAYVDGLESGRIAATLSGATPIGRPLTFQRPIARWRRYDRWQHPQDGLVVIGDAFAALNPLLGQGISVAAWEAALLADTKGDNMTQLCAQHRAGSAEAVAQAWTLSRIFNSTGDPSVPLLDDAAWDRIAVTVAADEDAHRRYVRVWHLLEPVESLLALAGAGDQL